MEIEEGTTLIGHTFIKFQDEYEGTATLASCGTHQLRCAFRDRDYPSLPAPFTIFTRDELGKILPYLQHFVETGELFTREETRD